MALRFSGFLLGAWVITHGVSADNVTATGEASCEGRLETMKNDLMKVQQAKTHAAPLALVATPGEAHWPASTSAYVPPLVQYFNDLDTYLRTMEKQYLVAGAAGLFGVLQLVHGPASFQTLLLTIFPLIAAASAQYELTLVWPSVNIQQQAAVAAGAAALAGLVVYQSLQGATILVGFLFGLGVSALLEPCFHTELWQLNFSLGWYSVWALMGILSFTVFQKYTLALVAPILGGFLLSSATGYFVAFGALVTSKNPQDAGSIPDWLHIQGSCWLDFAGALLGCETKAGIIGNVTTPGNVDPDRVLGRVLWFVLCWIGMKIQYRAATGRGYSRVGLREPLMDKMSNKV